MNNGKWADVRFSLGQFNYAELNMWLNQPPQSPSFPMNWQLLIMVYICPFEHENAAQASSLQL